MTEATTTDARTEREDLLNQYADQLFELVDKARAEGFYLEDLEGFIDLVDPDEGTRTPVTTVRKREI